MENRSILIFALLSALSPYERLAFYVNETKLSHMRTEADWDVLIERFGLDQPITTQYVRWLRNVLAGKLGYSTVAGMPLSQAIARRLPVSTESALLSVIP